MPNLTENSLQTKNIRILLADDHAILRSGLKLLLTNTPNFEVVAEATDGVQAVDLARHLKPDIIIMDISMPKMDGITATAAIKKTLPDIKILVLTMHEDDAYLFRTIQAGGSGYVLKKAADTELVEAIHHVMSGGAFLRPAVTTKLAQDYLERVAQKEPVEQDKYNKLTEREKEVLKLIAEGNTNAQIANILVISVRTVESHLAHVMEKLEIQNRSELVKYAIRKGLLELDS
jgi:two-component system, NarL family, response regulator NreC